MTESTYTEKREKYDFITSYNRRLEDASFKMLEGTPQAIKQAISDHLLACRAEATSSFLEGK
jgi:hypothetical protein